MTFEVILLPRAEADVDTIFQYLDERSPAGARSWNEQFLQVLDSLRKDPTLHGAAPENEQYDNWFIQQVIFKTRRGNPYRALFIVRKQSVYVVYVRGFGQDYATGLDDIQLP